MKYMGRALRGLEVATLILAILGFLGCANNKRNSSAPPPAQGQPMGNCAAGQVSHYSYGCLPQGNCGVGQGAYNGQCVPLTAQTPTNGGCPGGHVAIPGAGCTPQGNCPPNYGYYNNQCVQGNIATLPQGGFQYGSGSCVAGQVYTMYGCAPTAGCPNNYGMYNQQCYPPMTIGGNGMPNGMTNNNGNLGYPGYPGNGYSGNGYMGNGYMGNGYMGSYPNYSYGYSYPYYYYYPYSGASYQFGYPRQNPFLNFYLRF